MTHAPDSSSHVGIALAGGGPEGAIYEIGALRALDEALEGLDLSDLGVYVGVSAGAFLAANLANGLTTAQMCRAIIKHEPGEHPFVPENFLKPAVGQLVRSGMRVPQLLLEALWEFVVHHDDLTLVESLTRLGRALPVGLFNNDPIRQYLQKIYNIKGRSDDFRKLARKLLVVATDLDSGQAVTFGEPGYDHVPISQAVQASSALPGFYPPTEIDGRFYVDGVLLRTLHASVALEEGMDLLLCLNPIVPVDTVRTVQEGFMRRGQLIRRGLPTVISQTFRTLVHSRLSRGIAAQQARFSDRDILLFEPRPDDYRMFFTNVFSFNNRKETCEHAYRSTLNDLWLRRKELGPVLARHGIRLRTEILQEERDLWETVGLYEKRKPRPYVVDRLSTALERLEHCVNEAQR